MPPIATKLHALNQIDAALAVWSKARARSRHDDLSDLEDRELAELVATLSSTIDVFAPAGSTFSTRSKEIHSSFGPTLFHKTHGALFGVLKSLRWAYENDYLRTVEELIHADLFADFLDMAEHLLLTGYKDPAAVLVGGVLEEHLRKLCAKHGLATQGANGEPKKASLMNDELAKIAYDKLQQKGVTYWLDLRNKAAHGKFSEFGDGEVRQLLGGVRDFVDKFRA